MAAPLVSGAAALVRSVARDLKNDRVVRRLKEMGRKICGTPMRQLDVMAALDEKRSDTKVDCAKPPD